jgi:hypothetical protein
LIKKQFSKKKWKKKCIRRKVKRFIRKELLLRERLLILRKVLIIGYTNYSGKEKVKAELTAHAVAHNLRKVFNEAVKTAINSAISVIEVIKILV